MTTINNSTSIVNSVNSSPTPLESAPTKPVSQNGDIWWSNAIFFVGMHVLAVFGVMVLSPLKDLDQRTALMCFVSWQLAQFGITMGYHRLWSHKAYTASFALRCVLAGMGCLGFQGSIKWWVLRHRLHHRFTDTDSDPYNAGKGLLFSHMGWIFRKPTYARMGLIDRKDLNIDPVVRFQHKYYLPLTLALGFGLPTLIGWTYGDALGAFVWGGIVGRIIIWHCTFFINSLAHYVGEQSYSQDLTARGNFLLALFTGGEANHNYHHCFPKDYRNGPQTLDWDPTKWSIYLLHHFTPFVPKIYQTPDSEILKAKAHVLSNLSSHAHAKEVKSIESESTFAKWSSYAIEHKDPVDEDEDDFSSGSSTNGSDVSYQSEEIDGSEIRQRVSNKLPLWTLQELINKAIEFDNAPAASTTSTSTIATPKRRPVLVLLDGYALDVTNYVQHHPGGVAYLREYAIPLRATAATDGLKDASNAFNGGMNNHGTAARTKMKSLRIAKIID